LTLLHTPTPTLFPYTTLFRSQDGKLLWRYPWTTRYDLNIATPIYADGKVFVSSNYGTGGAVFRLKDHGEPETVWKSLSMQNHIRSEEHTSELQSRFDLVCRLL